MSSNVRALGSQLRRILSRHFSLDELHTLCYDMDVPYEDLGGEGLSGKTRELLRYVERRGQLAELVRAGRELRADIDWPEVPVPAPPVAEREPVKGPARVAVRQPFEPEMVVIPAGEFLMGGDPQVDPYSQSDEQPQHILYLPEYSIARTPATNAQYLAFVQATGQQAPGHWEEGKPPDEKREHPVVNVTWHDARAYCDWLAKVTGRPYRLPSEAQWEKGARGTDGRIYPWGNQWDASLCNSVEGGERDTTPVGAYPDGAGPYGLLDMAGNVWEWTRSLWGRRYPYDPDDGREDESADDRTTRVMRGGAFYGNARFVRCAARERLYPDLWYGGLGFRVVVGPGFPL